MVSVITATAIENSFEFMDLSYSCHHDLPLAIPTFLRNDIILNTKASLLSNVVGVQPGLTKRPPPERKRKS